ncbi:glycosyltransferase family 2 protein [Noviherbaspirillum sp. Root189]|uniref:glycosyltransferase family 2 protein n=1 Tax=Noviherbaspirillum sp. Root189 TaxID=1736487 RepID=UPI000A9D0DAC|nr:glycosyltransferase [Noviherbaspirillum sp. Root189]
MSKIIAFDRNRKNIAAEHTDRGVQAGGVVMRRRNGGPAVTPINIGSVQDGSTASIAASIVVPTRGRPQLLNRCLASLVLQSFDPDRFEIIIVDDGPSNDTREVVADWAVHTEEKGGPQVTYIPSMGPHGPAAARNHGWRAARGAIIAFTDDDTIARADWLRNGLQAFADDVHAVCGRIVMPLEHTPTDYELDAKNLETAEFVTANCFCRKKVLEDLGGFDERFRFAWREDSDLHFRLLDYRANIVREPNAVMMHPIRPAGWGVSLQQVKKVQFDALLYKKHPTLYRRKIRGKPRWDFYLTVGALLVMLVSLPADAKGVTVLSGLVWAFMTVRFCVQRLRKTSKAPGHVLEMLVTSALIPPMAVFWRAVGAFRYKVGFL